MTMASIFNRLAKSRPTPINQQQPDHAQRMLDFLLRWPRPSISAADMMTYGPRPRQNAEETLKIASILERHGWLTPIPTPRKDQHHWNIVRQHPIVHPKIDHSQGAEYSEHYF
jgi:hypothetical protein